MFNMEKELHAADGCSCKGLAQLGKRGGLAPRSRTPGISVCGEEKVDGLEGTKDGLYLVHWVYLECHHVGMRAHGIRYSTNEIRSAGLCIRGRAMENWPNKGMLPARRFVLLFPCCFGECYDV